MVLGSLTLVKVIYTGMARARRETSLWPFYASHLRGAYCDRPYHDVVVWLVVN